MVKRHKVEYDADKLRELILHISRQSEGDPCFGATKLNKILFYADFLAYRNTGQAITGAEYQKLNHGPAPRQLKPLHDRMEREKAIAVRPNEYGGYQQKRTLALREPILGKFTAEEIALVDRIIQNLWGKSATEVSDLSHRFIGWHLAKLGETIPYGVALLTRRDPTEKERAHGLKLEAAAEVALATR
jgi:Antitoxin SocA-like, Panacea domain